MNDSERVVVIGTGPAAAAAAVFLCRAGIEPLLLEAGSGKAALGLTARIRGLTLGKFRPELTSRGDLTLTGDPAAHLFEALAPGGLSNHWACAVPRFAPDDFEDAARAGEAYRWPLDYAELEPWYERVEPLLQIAGSRHNLPRLPAGNVHRTWELGREWDGVSEAARAVGRDVVAMPYAYGAETTLTRSGSAFNSYSRLIKPAEADGRLEVRYDAQALRLIWSNAERRVNAVVCRNPRTGSETHIPCRAVVLAAGAVNSAQILLESLSADFPTGLGNSQRVLGRYLHDHPLAKVVLDLGRAVPLTPASYITRSSLDREPPLYAAAFMQWAGAGAFARSVTRGQPGRVRRIGFSLFGTMAPSPEDCVALAANSSGAGRSGLMLSLRHPEQALTTLAQAKDELLALMQRAGWEPKLHVYRVEAPGNSVHYGGTCRMHGSPRFGVVDAQCRLFDARNVAVADSAVFTTGPEKNPVLTAMTLAARAADRLARDLRSGDA